MLNKLLTDKKVEKSQSFVAALQSGADMKTDTKSSKCNGQRRAAAVWQGSYVMTIVTG